LADTATFGSREAIECSKAFFSVERLLFATDMPFDPGQGPDYIRSTLAAIQSMELNVGDRRAILADNARRVFKLPD
jgi:aminocarboxymuconate-semialdehyde decarboxylase